MKTTQFLKAKNVKKGFCIGTLRDQLIEWKIEWLTAFQASRGLAHHSTTENAGGLSFWDQTRPGVSPPRWPSNHSGTVQPIRL